MNYWRNDEEMVEVGPDRFVNRKAYDLGVTKFARVANGEAKRNAVIGNSLRPWREWLADGEFVKERHSREAWDRISPKLWAKPSVALAPALSARHAGPSLVQQVVYRMLNGIPGWRRI